ncbi:MAG: 30S ribosomal protein S15 [Brevinematales bacterium]|jgi:small subunit ribosomal protein S15
MSITSTDKKTIIGKFARHEKDTGSSEVQIAIMSQKISNLTEHFKQFKKDNNSKRGLLRLIGRRRRLMRYLQATNPASFHNIQTKLKLK